MCVRVSILHPAYTQIVANAGCTNKMAKGIRILGVVNPTARMILSSGSPETCSYILPRGGGGIAIEFRA